MFDLNPFLIEGLTEKYTSDNYYPPQKTIVWSKLFSMKIYVS
jgi:hypothetical protein